MEKIGNIVVRELNRHQIGHSAIAAEIVCKANRFLAKSLPRSTEEARALSLKDGILTIGTGSAAMGQEIWAASEPLLKKLQSEFGPKILFKIRIKSLTTP
ncbi:hypothetical protein JXA05_03185 [Candidatus Peregrinibacteria bacterium]|nr:hypothetical protein [Candidatus Peregrinibacteria bacterium]